VLLTLLFVVALMAVFAAGVIIPIKFEMQRDQEQEMIHRGVQYSRAIRTYYKKFGRYPTKLEDLDNTSGLRYLRKHYEDPLNKNRDFKLLHYGDPGVMLGGGFSIGGGSIPGATPAGGTTGSAFGNPGGNSSGVFSQLSGGNSNTGFGGGSNSQSSSGPGTNSGSDSSQAVAQIPGTQEEETSSSTQPVTAGGPIVGVASISKKPSIREFDHKKKYNEWQFLYDPTTDRGGLITTPNQPALQGFGAQPALNGAQPAGSTGSAFGNSSGSSFGQSSSFGNNANPNTPAPPVQPPANSQPQQ